MGADLIVVEARGRTGLARLLLGSVAEGVTAAADAAGRTGTLLIVVHAVEPVTPIAVTPHLLSEEALQVRARSFAADFRTQ